MSVCEECLFDKLWTDETTTCPRECEGCQIIDGEPSKFKPKPKTNADRIRAMSDEELAHWLMLFVEYALDASGIDHDGIKDGEVERLLQMLQQSAEGEAHE